ncbi:MAG: hypothetical protein IT327_07730 [Anaerolineae bacterium]|nr:hypothetical protein [Anaerolineae bacterium]
MAAATITHSKIITEIHLVWDGTFYFLNRIRPAGKRPERITAERAAEIIRLNTGEPGVEVSTRGQVQIGSRHGWSWIATITTAGEED